MNGNITLFENNNALLYHTGSCNITLFAVLHFCVCENVYTGVAQPHNFLPSVQRWENPITFS